MTSWTERYLDAALRGIPDARRADLERELRSSITDAMDERLAAGQDAASAERAVLEALGDPAQLEAGYSGRPDYLIGPDLFATYRVMLPRLLAVTVLGGSLVLAVRQLFSGGNWADALFFVPLGVAGLAIAVAVLGTLAFVVLEHVVAARGLRDDVIARVRRWTIEDLPRTTPRRVTGREVAAELLAVAAIFAAMHYLWGLSVPGLNGANGLFDGPFTGQWLPIVMVALLARGALLLVVLAVGRWSMTLAGVNALLLLAFALPIVIIALSGQLIDFYYADGIGWHGLPDATGLPMLAVDAGVSLYAAWAIARGYVRAGATVSLRSVLPAARRSA